MPYHAKHKSRCHQNLAHYIVKETKYKPKMKVIKPKKKRPNSAEKRERIEKYRAAVKLVTTGRGASHNVHNIFSPLRLGVTRTPHWLKKHKRYGEEEDTHDRIMKTQNSKPSSGENKVKTYLGKKC